MSRIQSRFTVRWLMAAVALLAIMVFGCRRVVDFLIMLKNDDVVYHSFKDFPSKHWDLGTSPTVTVDLFDGGIVVIPSSNNEVVADVTIGAYSKSSQAAVDNAVMTIDSSFRPWKDTLRISVAGITKPGLDYSNLIELHVPNGTHLDLRTGRGAIDVGRDFLNGKWVTMPVRASSIRARNDTEYALGPAIGSVVVNASARPATLEKPPEPTLIRIDAPGRIDIVADAAIVEANAWHGNPPKQWPKGDYENGNEGTISFEGSLAKGVHSLRAAHRINLKLRDTASLRIDAEATSGQITGNLLPEQIEPVDGKASWSGSLGAEEGTIIQLRTSDGSIDLRSEIRPEHAPPRPSSERSP